MPKNNRPLFFTAVNSAGFFVLGVVAFQRAPSFNDLILISNTDVEGGSYYILASNFGFMLGSLLTGVLDGRIQRTFLTTAMGLLFSGVFTILTPWCTFFVAMFAIHCVSYIFVGVYETTIRSEEIQAWDGSSASALQFLSFCSFVGATIGPLITEPFMAPKDTENNIHDISSVNSLANTSTTPNMNVSIEANDSSKSSRINSIFCTNMVSHCTNVIDYDYNSSIIPKGNGNFTAHEVKSNLHYAYLISGALSILVSVLFLAVSTNSFSKKRNQKEDKVVYSIRKLPRKIYLGLLAMGCCYFFLYKVAANTYDQYLFYFVVTYLNWSKRNGAYLLSLDRAATMCFKLTLLVVYRYVKVRTVLLLSMSGAIVSITMFIIASHLKIDELVWAVVPAYSISVSAVTGGFMAWVDGNLIKLTGKETSAMMISASLAGITTPLPVVILMKNWSLIACPYFALFHLCVSGVVLLVMMFVVKSFIDRRYGPFRTNVEINVSGDDTNESMVQSEAMNGKEDGQKIEMVDVSSVA